MTKRRIARIAFLIWIAITVIALVLPTGKPPRLLQRGLDKTIHTGLFAIMGVLGQAAMPWSSLLITVPLAVGTEYLQRVVVTSREYNPVDLLANLIGAVLGLICYEISRQLK